MEASRKFNCLFLFSLFSLNHFIIFKRSATFQSFSLEITVLSLYISPRTLLPVLKEVLYFLSREKGRYRYAGQWKHGRMHGCGVFEVNERVLHVGEWIIQNLCFNLLTIVNLLSIFTELGRESWTL